MMNNAILNIQVILEDAAERLSSHHPENLYWYSFPQTWGSTALGFGGIGGAAMTTAQTVVVFTYGAPIGKAAVYFGGRFAYLVENAGEEVTKALDKRWFPPVRDCKKLESK